MFHKSIGNLGVAHPFGRRLLMRLQNNPLLVPVFVIKTNIDHQMLVQPQPVEEILMQKFYEHDK